MDGGETVGDFAPPPRRQVVLSLVCVGLAMFLAALSQTVVASIMTSIVADLGGFDRYTWPATSYLVAATVAYPIVGRLSDIYGRRAFLIAGIAIFIVGSALVGVSASMNQVIAFRLVQGIGGGIVMTCSYVSIADLFRPEDRGKFVGVLGALYAVATVVGPIMGAFVAEWLSWHWVFLFIALAGVPVLALTAWIYPRSVLLTRAEGLDYPGMAALVLAVAPVALALSSVGVLYSWDAPQVIGLLAFGLAMAGLFVAIESRSRSPIMPLGIYRDRAVAVAMVITLLTAASLHGFVLFLPLYFQVALGASVFQAGSLLAPMLLGIVVGAILAGQMLSRVGGHYRLQALVSTALMAGGMYLFSTLGDGGGFARNRSVLYSQLYLMVTALGFGGVVATLSVAVQNAVPYRDVGVATAALQFSRSLGGMMGLAITGVVMVQRFRLGVEAAVPDDLGAVLPTGLLAAVKDDPRALLDPATARALRESLAETGMGDVMVADRLLNQLNLALTDALSDVFTVLWIAVALSFAAALCLRVRNEDGQRQ
ncbi:MAG: MFS transporter [Chloroflexota bacterium]|nr:MFS transporter [Chloroflexota bacterium]MDE2960340.1 MFS transporter [Chloroflexota bacterium]